MTFKDLKELRSIISTVTIDEFIQFWGSINVDESYARENWPSFQDGPFLYMTWHSYGEELFNFIKNNNNDSIVRVL